MGHVTIQELCIQVDVDIDRVQTGDSIVVTRSGRPVAELRPLRRRGPDPGTLLARWNRLPHVDPDKMRHDVDQIIDPSLP